MVFRLQQIELFIRSTSSHPKSSASLCIFCFAAWFSEACWSNGEAAPNQIFWWKDFRTWTAVLPECLCMCQVGLVGAAVGAYGLLNKKLLKGERGGFVRMKWRNGWILSECCVTKGLEKQCIDPYTNTPIRCQKSPDMAPLAEITIHKHSRQFDI